MGGNPGPAPNYDPRLGQLLCLSRCQKPYEKNGWMAEAADATTGVEAMENAPKPIQAAKKPRGLGVLGHSAGRLQFRTVAYHQISRSDSRPRQCLLAQSWPCQFPTVIHLASYLTEPPDADPHVRWCGRGALPPYPDL